MENPIEVSDLVERAREVSGGSQVCSEIYSVNAG